MSKALPPLPSDPYRAPMALRTPGAVRAPGEFVKWIYLAAAGASSALTVAYIVCARTDSVPEALDSMVESVEGPLYFAKLGLGLVWIYRAWSGIPEAFRANLSPAGAVVRFCVPIYNFFWMFGFNMRLGEALDQALVDMRRPRRAPRTLAALAPAVHAFSAVATVFLAKEYWWFMLFIGIATDVMWFVYMLACDPVRREVVEAARERRWEEERREAMGRTF